MRLLVLSGDGIGPEITAATLEVLRRTAEVYAFPLQIMEDVAGHASLQKHGATVRPELLSRARAADRLNSPGPPPPSILRIRGRAK